MVTALCGLPEGLPPQPSGTYHEDDGHQVGHVGWEPVSPGQLHLVGLQHERRQVARGHHRGVHVWTQTTNTRKRLPKNPAGAERMQTPRAQSEKRLGSR